MRRNQHPRLPQRIQRRCGDSLLLSMLAPEEPFYGEIARGTGGVVMSLPVCRREDEYAAGGGEVPLSPFVKLLLRGAPLSRVAVLAAPTPPEALRGPGGPHNSRPGGRRYLHTN